MLAAMYWRYVGGGEGGRKGGGELESGEPSVGKVASPPEPTSLILYAFPGSNVVSVPYLGVVGNKWVGE